MMGVRWASGRAKCCIGGDIAKIANPMNKYKAESRRARKAYRKNKACGWKRAYATQEDAFQKGQNVYHCKYCKQWHRTGAMAELIAWVSR